MFGAMVTNTAGLLPAGRLFGSEGSWASLPLHCPPLPYLPLYASLPQLLPNLSVHSRTRGPGVERPSETWNCGPRAVVWVLGAKQGMRPNLPGVWEDMLPLSQGWGGKASAVAPDKRQ